MRAEPVRLTDFLPGNERLVRRADTFPFHYTWMNTNAVLKADFKNVYIAPFDVSYLRKGKEYDKMKDKAMSGYDQMRDALVNLDSAIDELGDYGRQTFVQAFKAREKETLLKVVDNPSLAHTMILEMAITAFVPTRAEVEVVGTVVPSSARSQVSGLSPTTWPRDRSRSNAVCAIPSRRMLLRCSPIPRGSRAHSCSSRSTPTRHPRRST